MVKIFPNFTPGPEIKLFHLYLSSVDRLGKQVIILRDGDNDVLIVPDEVWDAEKNWTMTHPEGQHFVRQVGNCNGVPSTVWGCCSAANPCSIGGGDCNRDSDCAGNLKCGRDNCRGDFSSSGSNWSRAADCCVGNYMAV